MSVLVTGGAGYIGSHTVKLLNEKDYDVIVFDNFSRGHIESLPKNVKFENVDLLDYTKLKKIVPKYDIDAVIHFAALAYVEESVEKPDLYYTNNVTGSLNLLKVLKENGTKKFVFSSTCSLYGNPEKIPIAENQKENPINPYAKTKHIIEIMLKDFDHSFGFMFVSLRYFNAAGADPGGRIGESHDPETHLIPLVLDTALGKRDKIIIFGDDYETADGTCVRDYIHVDDLAEAHVKALEYLSENRRSNIINLGTGKGYSVKEVVDIAKEITNINFDVEVSRRREGDPAVLIADNKKAKEVLNWQPKYDLYDIIKSAWGWHKNQKY